MCATYCVLPVSIVESIVVSILRPLCVHHASIMSLYFALPHHCMIVTVPVALSPFLPPMPSLSAPRLTPEFLKRLRL